VRYAIALVLAVAGIVLLILFSPSRDGYEDDVLATARACPLAMDALGQPLERRMWGLQTGHASGHSQRRRFVTQDVLVRGPKAEGTITVDAYFHDSRWTVRTAVLRAGSRDIELTRCGWHTPAKLQGKRTITAHVKAATGSAPAAVGQACTMQVERTNDGEECRAVVECAGKAIYGATPQLGYHLCGLVATPQGNALVGIDTDRRYSRTEPTMRFDERTGEIALGSEKAPDWSLTLAMGGR
jgi:hypothetical protein